MKFSYFEELASYDDPESCILKSTDASRPCSARSVDKYKHAKIVCADTRTCVSARNIFGRPWGNVATNQRNNMQANHVTRFGDTSGGLSRKVDDANSTVHHAIDRASSAAGPTIDQVAAGAHQAADRLAVAANHATASLETAAERLKATQARLVDSCASYVREKPVTGLCIAVASGFLLGLLAGRR